MGNGKAKGKPDEGKRRHVSKVFALTLLSLLFRHFIHSALRFGPSPKDRQKHTERQTDRQTVSHQWVVGECGGKSP